MDRTSLSGDGKMQCVILAGGLGTRLGHLTAETPKPMLAVGGKPFIETLLREAARRGFRDVLLSAGYKAKVVADYATQSGIAEEIGANITVAVEPEPLGTGGALNFNYERLADEFLLINGDTWFDFNWLDLYAFGRREKASVAVALRTPPLGNRYETVQLDGSWIVDFRARSEQSGHGLINGGVYYATKQAVQAVRSPSSLEGELFPELSRQNRLAGRAYDGFFIDIGLPETFFGAQTSVPDRSRRPAVFFDRDDVLIVDRGYTHRVDDLVWMPGAIDAIKLLNDRGVYVFVVTNQAGVARGCYSEADVRAFHAAMADALAAKGAYIDDWRFCPYHPQAVVAEFRADHPWRKPHPGMILDLLKSWPIDAEHSLLIGDKDTDIQAGVAAKISSQLFLGGNIYDFVRALSRPEALPLRLAPVNTTR